MKITAIGVNSAFATGTYKEAVPVKDACDIAMKIANSPQLKGVSEEVVVAEIRKRARRFYAPKWQSNFLIEFDMAGKRGKNPYRMLLDVGGDVRHTLKSLEMSSADIDGIYISHPHNDHIGGMEYMGLTTLFNSFYTSAKKQWLGNQYIASKLFLE